MKDRYTPPAHAHWATKRIFELLNEEHAALADVAHRSGVSQQTIENWRTRNGPSLRNVEAVLNTLGCDLLIRRRG